MNISGKKNIALNVHKFTRSCTAGTIVGSAAYNPYTGAIVPTFNLLPTPADFTTLFDRYMITYVKVKFHLKVDPGAQAAASAVYPKLWYCRDYTDGTTPANLNELRERSGTQYRVMSPNKPVVVGFKPAVLSETYRGPVSTGYGSKWFQWIDSSYTDVPHYGLKYCIDPLINTNYSVDVEVKMWFKCKDTK